MSDTDKKLLHILGDGSATWIVAARMGWDTPRTNRSFRRLEKAGVVRRSPRSAVNNIIWMPA
jgi:DNA-binding Lrp family transcriptional regulator